MDVIHVAATNQRKSGKSHGRGEERGREGIYKGRRNKKWPHIVQLIKEQL